MGMVKHLPPHPSICSLLGDTSYDLHQLYIATSLTLCLKTPAGCWNESHFLSVGGEGRIAEGKAFTLACSHYCAASDGCAWELQLTQVLPFIFTCKSVSACRKYCCQSFPAPPPFHHSLPLISAWSDCSPPGQILQQHFTSTFGTSTQQHPSGAYGGLLGGSWLREENHGH